MMEFLNFTFQSPGHFFGVLILISAIGGALSHVARGIFIRTSFDLIEPKIRKVIVRAIREANKP